MINNISAVVVTRGDHDLTQLLTTLGNHFSEVICVNNQTASRDLKVFGRYAGAFTAKNNFIYIQDDDCVVDVEALIRTYDIRVQEFSVEGAYPIVCNFPSDRRDEYKGSGVSLLGWGTIFHKSHLSAFNEYLECYVFDDLFLRECDRIFSYLHRNIIRYDDVRMQQLAYAYGDDRMGKEPRHRGDLIEVKRRLEIIDSFLRRVK